MKGRASSPTPASPVASTDSREERRVIPFRAVNRADRPGYDPALQRHHLLPSELLTRKSFGAMFDSLDPQAIGFEDFRRNGMLLPAQEDAALRTALPLHRGPHRQYNELVVERVGQIERGWSALHPRDPDAALREAWMRLGLLQAALRRRLLHDRKRLRLNRHDPLGAGRDFTHLDAMADMLWGATEGAISPPLNSPRSE